MRVVKTSEGFVVSVGVMPCLPMSLEHDIRLAKSALLLADKVRLYSPTAAMLSACRKMGEWSQEDLFRVLVYVAPYLMPERAALLVENEAGVLRFLRKSRAVSKLTSFKAKSRTKLKAQEDFQRVAVNGISELLGAVQGIADGVEMGELDRAVASGSLDIETMGVGESREGVMQFIKDAVVKSTDGDLGHDAPEMAKRTRDETERIIDGLGEAVLGGESYPIFDSGVAKLIGTGLAEGRFTGTVANSKQAQFSGFGQSVFDRLTLDDVGMDEILDIRKELDPYLSPFRRKLGEFSSELQEQAWSPGFSDEAETIFRTRFEPELEELRASIKGNKFIQPLLIKGGILGTAGTISWALGDSVHMPALLSMGIAGGVGMIYDSASKFLKTKTEIKSSGMFFYYSAEDMILKS